MIDFYSIVSAQVLTEKYSGLSSNVFVFYSSTSVSKLLLRKSIKQSFPDVVISSISSMIIKGKVRRFKGFIGKTKERKRFVISLSSGSINPIIGG